MSRRDLLVLGQRVPGDLKAAIENVEKAVLSNGPLMQDEKEQLPAAIQGICDILKKNSDPMVLARAASCAGTLAHVRRKHREELVDRGMVSSLLAMCAPRTTGENLNFPEHLCHTEHTPCLMNLRQQKSCI